MVLPKGIEPLTSALPRMRSTTELRQHIRGEPRAYGRAARDLSRKAMGQTNDKDERLAAALRENLKRRKAQARGTAKPDLPPPPERD